MAYKAMIQRIATTLLALGGSWEACANPQGLSVASGSASVAANGPQLDITASHNAFLNWQSFNIARGETTTFHQPSPASVVWNKINDPNPSQIFGHLNANGIVVLMNQSGFYFGPGSVVNAAGFVATTATTLPEFGIGGVWQFNGPPPLASIVNYGEIKVDAGGSAFLIAEKVENHGVLSAPDGTLGLYAGKEVLMSERPDGRGISVSVKLPEGSVDNRGKLVADAGSIFLHAQNVNQDGYVQANSIRERNGVIELVASDGVNLGANSVLEARGDDAASSSGGRVTIKSDGTFQDEAGSKIAIAGGAPGGNGGEAEISAPLMTGIKSSVDGHAAAGSVGGALLIDPTDILINSTGTGSANGGNVSAGSAPTTLQLNANSAFLGLANITLQATRNITLAGGTTWDLASSTGIPDSAPGKSLTLQAGNDIIFQTASLLRAGPGWSVALSAGTDFANANATKSGIGSITFQGTAGLEAQDGAVSLKAGKDVTLASGFVRTMGGGNIDVLALGGNVNTGTKASGFKFSGQGSPGLNNYFSVDPDLGGISTGAGGDVSITAGKDITSLLPINGNLATDAGSGAFGAQPGNVTLNAGGNVSGHFVVRNGTGSIQAGADAGTVSRQLALSLVAGGWNVNAAQNIRLQEVRNPNGIFNNLGFSSSLTKHYFDYAADAFVNLTGGNSVQLLGSLAPRNSGTFEQAIKPIYPPKLDISAGAGGVQVGQELRLFPSAQGQLQIGTSAGGSLVGTKSGDLVPIIMSDSGTKQFKNLATFGADDHATAPLHVNDPEPVKLDIAGDMSNVLLVSPKHAEINVGGNVVNSRLNVQNLHAGDTTTLNVTGDILNRNEFTSVPLNQPPMILIPGLETDNVTIFDRAYPPLDPSLAGLVGKLSYNAGTHTLTFQGRMSSAELAALTALTVQKYDGLTPLFDQQTGLPILETVAVIPLAAAQSLFDRSQDIPLNPDTGYFIAGPGTFNVNAHNLDLGATRGIQSIGPAQNHALAPLGNSGAAVNVTLTGDLDMFSTTISTLAGGGINIHADGRINVGSTEFTSSDSLARGIFTVARSDVSVTAGGDINVSGSRIATYDGGNITVISEHGNVDAGKGGTGAVAVEKVIIDPLTGEVKTYTPTIPFSGILATTFPPSLDPTFPNSLNPAGGISIQTPQGNIIANAGGILQLALNGILAGSGPISITAGTSVEVPDPAHPGNVITAVIYPGDVDASGSGVIGVGAVKVKAARNVKGVFFSPQPITIFGAKNVDVTAISLSSVDASAGDKLTGTLVGLTSVNASGSSIDASLLSKDVNASGGEVSGQQGFAQTSAAGATSQAASNNQEETTKATVASNNEEDDEKKKRAAANNPVITRRVGRVTVILPQT